MRSSSPRDAEFTEYAASRTGWLRKIAYLLCGDWHRADDLVQETIARLYVNWSRAGRAENRDGYARRLLVTAFLAEQRTPWWRRPRTGATTAPAGRPAGADGDAAPDLRQALAGLPPRQRAVMVLRYYCDLSVEQTADLMGCSTGHVKTQTSRGLDVLGRSYMQQPVGGNKE